MKIVKEIDPTGVENRRKQTLKRRKYHSKVSEFVISEMSQCLLFPDYSDYKVQITSGILMVMTSCPHMDSKFMGVLMG